MRCGKHSEIPQQAAFTLVELLLVVVVLGIVAVIVLPSIGGSDGVRLMSAARLLAADLDYARVESLGSAADRCVVVFEPSGGGYHLARASDPATAMMDKATKQPYVRVFGEGDAAGCRGVTVDPLGVGGDRQVGFTSLGRLDQGSDARVDVVLSGQRVTVVVAASTGEPTIQP